MFVANSDAPTDLPNDVQSVRPLALQASDPELHTCEYKLADKPIAVALRNAAAAYLFNEGLVSESQLADPSTIWMVSDRLFSDGSVAVFTLVQKPAPAPFAANEQKEFMTLFKSKTGGIIGASPVNLYAAAPPVNNP